MNRHHGLWARALGTPIRALVTSVCVVAAAATACKRDPAAIEAEHEAADRAQLTDAVMLDVQVDGLLRKADALARNGEDEKATALVTNEALPAAERAITAADAVHPASAWGAARTKELADLAHARRDALPAYVASLASEDLQAKLDATMTQVKLEQEALVVLGRINGDSDDVAAPALTASGPDAHL